jgi:hypothetical protein
MVINLAFGFDSLMPSHQFNGSMKDRFCHDLGMWYHHVMPVAPAREGPEQASYH